MTPETSPADATRKRVYCRLRKRVTLISWEAEHPEQQIGQDFIDKNHSISILHTGYKVIGYMFAKQSNWYKLRGLLFKLRHPLAFQLSRGLLLGAY